MRPRVVLWCGPGDASSGEEGIVSEDISRSRMRLVQTRWKAWGCGRFWCPCVGVVLPKGCGLKRWRSHKEVCGRTSAGCALDCGQENYGPGWSCGVGPRRSPGATPGGPYGGGLGGRAAGAVRGPQWIRARGPRVCCGAQRGEGVPRLGSHKEVCGQESTAQGGHVALAQGGPSAASGRLCGCLGGRVAGAARGPRGSRRGVLAWDVGGPLAGELLWARWWQKRKVSGGLIRSPVLPEFQKCKLWPRWPRLNTRLTTFIFQKLGVVCTGHVSRVTGAQAMAVAGVE